MISIFLCQNMYILWSLVLMEIYMQEHTEDITQLTELHFLANLKERVIEIWIFYVHVPLQTHHINNSI